MKKIRVLVFGNPLVGKDSLPLQLLPQLKKEFPSITFIEADINELEELQDWELSIIDTVYGLKKVELIKDVESIQIGRIYSLHDFDLAYNLKLLKKMNKLKNICIFGIPPNYNKKKAWIELKNLIKSNLLSRNA